MQLEGAGEGGAVDHAFSADLLFEGLAEAVAEVVDFAAQGAAEKGLADLEVGVGEGEGVLEWVFF